MSAVTPRPFLYALAVALLATAPARALAPEEKTRAQAPARAPAPLVGGAAGPDDLALRYYASLGQSSRVDSELARLRRLYPDYEPPTNLYETPTSSQIDEEPFWTLFAADRIDELNTAIAAKRRTTPGWRPSADLSGKLRRKELRLRISSLSAQGKAADLVDYVKGESLEAIAGEPDLLWMVAEAHAVARQREEAVATFRLALGSGDSHIRLATVQKALAALRMADVEALLASVSGAAGGENEFAALAIDITRARVAAFLHDERKEEIPVEEMRAFESYAEESRDPRQLGLVAWYDYKRRDFAAALRWFKLAIQNDGDAMIAHGLAHSLRALGMKREAEEVAYAWREPLANNVILFLDLLEAELTREIPPYLEPQRLARYARATMEAGSGEGAQALAWYAYNSCQWDAALFWFERAVAWFPKEATVYGYALTLRRLKKDPALLALANRYDGLFPMVVELLFPDAYYRPPTPCDGGDAARLHGPGLRIPGLVVPGPALIPGAAPDYAPQGPARAAQGAAYPLSLPLGQEDAGAQRLLGALRGKFPAAVAMENPLRFRPAAMPPVFAPPPAAHVPSAPASPLRKEPAALPAPLVARRTPGVGPMPYEHYGFSLLPGWNGQEQASWPPYSRRAAPPGTQWALQEADPARGGEGARSLDTRMDRTPTPGPGARPAAPQAPAFVEQPQPMRR